MDAKVVDNKKTRIINHPTSEYSVRYALNMGRIYFWGSIALLILDGIMGIAGVYAAISLFLPGEAWVMGKNLSAQEWGLIGFKCGMGLLLVGIAWGYIKYTNFRFSPWNPKRHLPDEAKLNPGLQEFRPLLRNKLYVTISLLCMFTDFMAIEVACRFFGYHYEIHDWYYNLGIGTGVLVVAAIIYIGASYGDSAGMHFKFFAQYWEAQEARIFGKASSSNNTATKTSAPAGSSK